MSTQFFSKLSQNYIELLEDDEYYDITIEVGNDPYVKIFRAHMVILNYRSPYLRRILSTNKKKNDRNLLKIQNFTRYYKIFKIRFQNNLHLKNFWIIISLWKSYLRNHM